MYNQFFGLHKQAFVLTPNPDCVFFTPAHREALAGLSYAVTSRKGFVLLTGDAGTGKTTILNCLLQSCGTMNHPSSVILNPTLTPSEFLELLMLDFGFTEVPASKAQRLVKLQHFLVGAHASGKTPVLVIDEAQRLSADVLEEIRLLANFENADCKLLQIVLAGQSEVAATLNRADLRQFKQRIAVRLSIRPLHTSEVKEYIVYRWRNAGGAMPIPFDESAIELITQYSRGIPRLVNTICDNALLLAYGEGVHRVETPQIVEVARDLDLIVAVPKVNGAGIPPNGPAPPNNHIERGSDRVEVTADPIPKGPESVFPTLDRYTRQKTRQGARTSWLAKLGLAH